MDIKAELDDFNDLMESLRKPKKAELYRPVTTTFTDEVVHAAMKVIVDVIQSGTCDNREVFEAAKIVLSVAAKPIELSESTIAWKSPM